MSLWTAASTALLAAMRSAVVPSVSVKPSALCAFTRLPKRVLRSSHRDAQRRDRASLGGGERGLDAVEAALRQLLPRGEIFDLVIGRVRDEFRRRGAYHQHDRP